MIVDILLKQMTLFKFPINWETNIRLKPYIILLSLDNPNLQITD